MAADYCRALLFLIATTCFFSSVFGECPPEGGTCEPAQNCFCPGTLPPNGLRPDNIPQIVFITFDDAIGPLSYELYEYLIFNRKNPNGANITATFFISHEYNDYQLTHQAYRKGHEIALHSITHAGAGYWQNLDYDGWLDEILGQKLMVSHFARIPVQMIRGFRAPERIGGDLMYKALYEAGLEYESSRVARLYAGRAPKLWPYTSDYNIGFQQCQNDGPCPVLDYPGFWTSPLVSLFGNNTNPCTSPETCQETPTTQQEMFDLLKWNFDNHYITTTSYGNRAPFGIYTRAGFYQGAGDQERERLAGFVEFLDYLATLNDVYIVSMSRALEWIRNPVPIDQIQDFAPWQNREMPPDHCSSAQQCLFRNDQTPVEGERIMQSCMGCPRWYPWLKNPYGDKNITLLYS